MQQQTSFKLFSNSCIELSIPFEYQQCGSICCNWMSAPSRIYQSYLAQFITSQHYKPKDKQRTFYLCSPLDIGSLIMVKIQNQGVKEKTVLQHLKYGPVQLEPSLLSSVQTNNWRHAEVLLNKNTKKQAAIRVESQSKQMKRQSYSISVVVKLNEIQLNFHYTEELAKQNLQSFQKHPFFKIYDSQPNAVGIYIAHQNGQFEQRLKDLQISAHFGQYLKLYFENRLCRDIFMVTCISKTDLNVDSIKQFRQKSDQLQNFYNKANSSLNILSSLKNISKQLLKIPKIQTTIRASQIMNNEFIGVEFNESQTAPKIQEDILQDIYNILYTPINKIERKSLHIQTPNKQKNQDNSIYINEANTGEITLKLNQEVDEFQDVIDHQAKNSYPGEQQIKKGNQSTEKNSQPQVKKLQSLNICRKQANLNKQQPNLLTAQNFKHQLNQINLLQKINQLLKINEQLVSENRQLRIQNEKLKSDSTKNEKLKQLHKMLEIKQMVQIMAQKLESLQQENEANNFASTTSVLQHKKLKKYQTRPKFQANQRQLRQSSKRFWSPRTHEQLVKNFKQKNVEEKQTAKKADQQQLNRQKSISYLGNQNPIKSKPSQLKQHAGKAPHFLASQAEVSDKLKPQKIDLHQTLQFNDRSKKPKQKQALLSSAKDFQISSQKQKTSNAKNGNSNANKLISSFRNVFGQ